MGTLLAATAVAAWLSHRQTDAARDRALRYEAARVDEAVTQRMQAYVQVLVGGAGLFDASRSVTRAEWVTYVSRLQVDRRYPGFKSLTFAAAVPDRDLAAFAARQRRGLPGYTVRSPVPGVDTHPTLHAPIVYVAPERPDNLRVLGVDMMQEPHRQAAMERAAATGDAVLSPRLALAGQGDQQAGFIAYLPVRKAGRLQGWLTAAFLAPEFFRGLLGTATPKVDFEVRDGGGALLYSTAPAGADGAPRPLPHGGGLSTTVALPGQTWSLRYVPTAALPSDRWLAWLVLLCGLLLSALVGVVLVVIARANATVEHQATHDPLTGLANRALLEERLAGALAAGAPFALAFLDLDRFKPVNDTFGHATGDALLRAVAGRIRARVREDDVVARIGGDEFAVLLAGPDRADGFAAEIAGHLATPFSLDAGHVEIGASVGVARFPGDGDTPAALLAAADAAMYDAKHQRVP